MAIYFLNLRTFGRSAGSSAVSAAAYRAGERIRDERTGRMHDHSARSDVLHKEIILPPGLDASQLEWSQDRAHLWNAAERAEIRRNARVAREYLVTLPHELDPDRRRELARQFAQELAGRYKFAVDLVVHAPRDFPDSDPRNFHAHLLTTTREATAAGLAGKTTLEWNDGRRREAGLGPGIDELLHVRRRWAEVANQVMAGAHIDARIDHRSLAAQGIDRVPLPRISHTAWELERRGFQSYQAEHARREYQARLAAHETAKRALTAPRSLEEVRRLAREDWLRFKETGAAVEPPPAGRTRDDDLTR